MQLGLYAITKLVYFLLDFLTEFSFWKNQAEVMKQTQTEKQEKKTQVFAGDEEKVTSSVWWTRFIKVIKQKGKSIEQTKPSISMVLKKYYCLSITESRSEP